MKFCVALSVLALILKVIVFVSPGWVVVKHHMGETYPTDLDKNTENSMEMGKGISVSFGMWYYKVCMCSTDKGGDDDDSGEKISEDDDDDDSGEKISEDDDDGDSGEKISEDDDDEKHHHKYKKHHRHHKCYHSGYKMKRHPQRIDYVGDDMNEAKKEDRDFDNGIPKDFSEGSDFIIPSVEFARHARHELAAYVTIGLILGVIGVIGSVRYSRGGGNGKHSGRLACSTQVLSSFFFWLAIVRTATYIIQLRVFRDHKLDSRGELWFSVPWCLVLGSIGAIIMDISALFHLILISRDRKPAGAEYIYNTENIGKTKVPIIAPKGYEQLVVPPYSTVEAAPLPEKQYIS